MLDLYEGGTDGTSVRTIVLIRKMDQLIMKAKDSQFDAYLLYFIFVVIFHVKFSFSFNQKDVFNH